MTTNNRDDFSAKIKRILAERVGFLCSCPSCRVLTIGPHSNLEKSANVGVAAHITAAAIGGPRYDASLSPEERSGISNGILLCENCAKIIDKDPENFPVELLREWKAVAEKEAKEKRGKLALSSTVSPILEAELIYNNSGRVFHGYTNEILNKYANNVIEMAEVKNLPMYYKLDWNYELVLVNNSETPVYNVSVEYVQCANFFQIESLPRINNLKPFGNLILKVNVVNYFKGTYQNADLQVSQKYPPLIQGSIIRIRYQDNGRNKHSNLLIIKENGIIESQKEM